MNARYGTQIGPRGLDDVAWILSLVFTSTPIAWSLGNTSSVSNPESVAIVSGEREVRSVNVTEDGVKFWVILQVIVARKIGIGVYV